MNNAAGKIFGVSLQRLGWFLMPMKFFGLYAPKRLGVVQRLGLDFILHVQTHNEENGTRTSSAALEILTLPRLSMEQ